MAASTKNYRDSLSSLRRRLVSSRFLRWWLGELASMVPTWLKATSPEARSFLVLPLQEVGAGRTDFTPNDKRSLALTLPRSNVLRKTLTLPLATEESLRQVLEFQLEQLTPFAPNQIYFGYAVLARDFERNQIKVDFVAAPREPIDSAIKTLDGQGTLVHAVFAEEMWNQGVPINLLPNRLTRAPSPLRQGMNPWLLSLLGVLVLASLALPLIIKREAVVQLLPWVEKGKKAAEAVDVARRELEGRIAQHNFVLEKRHMTPTAIQVLEELTRVLPDDTWVRLIELKGKELLIQGETASSVRLIGLFEQSKLFKDASFRSPLTKGQTSGSEYYQLALQIRPMPTPLLVSPPGISASAPVRPTSAASASDAPSPKASAPAQAASTGVKP
jgi:general secretion pathway protein L